MIDQLHRLAQRLFPLKWLVLMLTVGFAMSVVGIVLSSSADGDKLLLIPCTVGFLAMLTASSLITNFQTVPRRAEKTDSLWVRLKIRFYRLVFSALALSFIATTLTFLILASRLLGIWINAY